MPAALDQEHARGVYAFCEEPGPRRMCFFFFLLLSPLTTCCNANAMAGSCVCSISPSSKLSARDLIPRGYIGAWLARFLDFTNLRILVERARLGMIHCPGPMAFSYENELPYLPCAQSSHIVEGTRKVGCYCHQCCLGKCYLNMRARAMS